MENIKFIEQNLEKGLYLVSTPIGNLADITIRALNILKKSDIILCEDKRVSKKLLDYYEIKAQLFSYHKFNEKESVEKILEIFKKNKIVSLIRIFPGSDINGVPASLIKDTILFFLKISNIFSTDSFSLNL